MSSKAGLVQHFPKQVSHPDAGGIGGTGQVGTGDAPNTTHQQQQKPGDCPTRAAQARMQFGSSL